MFSVIPRLSSVLQQRLPDVEVVEVKLIGNVEGKYNKKVYEEEMEFCKDAEIMLVDNNLLAQMTHRLPKLKWAQCSWAGVEGLVNHFKDKPKPAFQITRMVGDAFSQLMAEYAIGWIINHERGWLKAREYQLKSEWAHKDNIAYYRSLQDMTIGILGMGNIGKEVARSVKAFRGCVHAYTRTSPSEESKSADVDKYWHTGELASFLQQCDYFINIMPSTPATIGMLGGEVLKDAKKNAVFMNIGRGDVISEADIIKSLDAGWISAAILDVFIPEPLPADSPLWKHPRVVLTPHAAGVSRAEDVVYTFCFNYKRYIESLPVMYTVDWNSGY